MSDLLTSRLTKWCTVLQTYYVTYWLTDLLSDLLTYIMTYWLIEWLSDLVSDFLTYTVFKTSLIVWWRNSPHLITHWWGIVWLISHNHTTLKRCTQSRCMCRLYSHILIVCTNHSLYNTFPSGVTSLAIHQVKWPKSFPPDSLSCPIFFALTSSFEL